MKQKIVIMVSMPCGKCRTKAMALAAKATGVISVEITGDYADRLEVVGDGIDPVCLVGRLRKKVGWAVILQVEEVKAKKPEEEKPHPLPQCYYPCWYHCPPVPQCYPGCYHCPPVPQCYYPGCYHCPPVPQMVIYDESSASSCSIM